MKYEKEKIITMDVNFMFEISNGFQNPIFEWIKMIQAWIKWDDIAFCFLQKQT